MNGRGTRPVTARVRRFGLSTLVAAVLAAAAAGPLAAQGVWLTGVDRPFSSIGAAIAAAAPGDTVRVEAGRNPENLVVERPVQLIGEGWPVLDGGGRGHVVQATAPIAIRGFVLRNSGSRVETEDSGLLVDGAPARIEGNLFEDILYGIHLKNARGSVLAGNSIRGRALPLARRGDGIRLWYSSGSTIAGNVVRDTRDLVVYFSDSLTVEGNLVTGGRYGLHTMYSSHGRFARNRLEANHVAAFLMYSEDVALDRNVFADAAGASGMGLGLKDVDRVEASGNLIAGNPVGVHLDSSPKTPSARNRFVGNAFADNAVAVRLLPAVEGNVFRGNSFVANGRPAEVAGGTHPGQARQNAWNGNHWGDYAGFDADGDGVGDTPYEHVRLGDEIVSRHPALGLFTGSPALAALDAVGRILPLLEPEPVVVDAEPRREGAVLLRWGTAGQDAGAGPGAAALWALLAAVSAGLAWRGCRPRGRS